MKRVKLWIAILICWIQFLIVFILSDYISSLFIYPDITLHDGAYHYGICSFSITVALVFMVLGILYVILVALKNIDQKYMKAKSLLTIGILVFSFVIQFFFYLSWWGYYYLFGIAV